MGRLREARSDARFAMKADKDHPFASLGNAVPGCVEQRISDLIALIGQVLGHQFSNVAAAVIEDVRDIFHQQGDGLYLADVVHVTLPQIYTTVDKKGIVGGQLQSTVCLLAELCAADARERLTGRTPDEHVDLVVDRTLEANILEDLGWVFGVHISCHMVSRPVPADVMRAEVCAMG